MFDLQLEVPARKLLTRATITSIWPTIVMLPNAIALSSYILQKSSFTGAQLQPNFTIFVADGVAGAVIGLATLSSIGFLTPWIAYASGKSLRVSHSCLHLCTNTCNSCEHTRGIPNRADPHQAQLSNGEIL